MENFNILILLLTSQFANAYFILTSQRLTTGVQQQPNIRTTGKRLVTTQIVFIVTLVVTVLTILSIWLFGLGQHRRLFENSMLSTSILSLAFFLFLAVGLYKGIKLKDNLGKITDKIKIENLPDFSGLNFPSDLPDAAEGLAALLLAVSAWLLFSLLLLLFIWLFSALLWPMILVFVAMLYWIFFRALRLVFKNSHKCKGDLMRSIKYGFGYTLLYNFWIYGILLVTHYLVK